MDATKINLSISRLEAVADDLGHHLSEFSALPGEKDEKQEAVLYRVGLAHYKILCVMSYMKEIIEITES